MNPISKAKILQSLSLATLPVYAAVGAAETLQTIEVTATTGTESGVVQQTGDVVFEEHTGVVSRISRDELDNDAAGLADVLDRQTGTQTRSSGGFGSYSEVSLRGAGSDQVRVYLDGLPLSDGTGAVNLADIDAASLAGADIYRGATPLQLAGASFGGAVNLRTAEGKTPTRLHLGYGALDSYKAGLQSSLSHGRFSGLVSLNAAGSDNDFRYTDDNGTRYNSEDDRTVRRHNTQAHQQSLLLKGAYRTGDNTRFDSTVQGFHKEQGIAAWNNSADNQASFDTSHWRWRGRYTRDALAGGQLNSAYDLYLSRKDEEYDDRLSQVGLGSQYDRYRTTMVGAQSYLEWLGDNSTSALKLDLHREKYRRRDLLEVDPTDRSRRNKASLALQHAHWFADEKLLLTPALRAVWYRDRYRLEGESSRRSEQSFNPQLGLQYTFPARWTLKANIGRYSREPGYYELFGDRGLFLGNADLLDESGTNADIGLSYVQHQPFAGIRELRAALTVFDNRIDDMIARTYDARGIGKSENIGKARLRGIEFESSLIQDNGWQWRLNTTVQDPENRSAISAYTGKTLPGRETLAASASVSVPLARHRLSISADYRSKRYYDTPNLLEAPSRTLWNMQYRHSINKRWQAALAVSNLSDEKHEDFNGFPKPGRLWTVSLTYTPDP
ncbi:TonB-dependent receptor [Granulosicoccaceae sp. 1_MG-2023]|nr:TonB-dependent receptor [Granulosicoccaceae sp. 1_MG-2023]